MCSTFNSTKPPHPDASFCLQQQQQQRDKDTGQQQQRQQQKPGVIHHASHGQLKNEDRAARTQTVRPFVISCLCKETFCCCMIIIMGM